MKGMTAQEVWGTGALRRSFQPTYMREGARSAWAGWSDSYLAHLLGHHGRERRIADPAAPLGSAPPRRGAHSARSAPFPHLRLAWRCLWGRRLVAPPWVRRELRGSDRGDDECGTISGGAERETVGVRKITASSTEANGSPSMTTALCADGPWRRRRSWAAGRRERPMPPAAPMNIPGNRRATPEMSSTPPPPNALADQEQHERGHCRFRLRRRSVLEARSGRKQHLSGTVVVQSAEHDRTRSDLQSRRPASAPPSAARRSAAALSAGRRMASPNNMRPTPSDRHRSSETVGRRECGNV